MLNAQRLTLDTQHSNAQLSTCEHANARCEGPRLGWSKHGQLETRDCTLKLVDRGHEHLGACMLNVECLTLQFHVAEAVDTWKLGHSETRTANIRTRLRQST
jgi:hypothetical protein